MMHLQSTTHIEAGEAEKVSSIDDMEHSETAIQSVIVMEEDNGDNFQTIRNWWQDVQRFGFPLPEEDNIANISQDELMKNFHDLNKLCICDPFVALDGLKHEVLEGSTKSSFATVRFPGGIICEGKWKNGGRRQGKGTLRGEEGSILRAKNVAEISGKYVDGLLQGRARIYLAHDDIVLEGNFSQGRLHGNVRGFSKGLGDVVFAARFDQGYLAGPAWKLLEGDGFIYGSLGPNGRFTGRDITYIYSDFETCITGRFENGRLVRGRENCIIGTRIEKNIAVLTFEGESGPAFEYWPSTLTTIPVPPKQEDPYEKKFVSVRKSGMNGAGEGLFASRDLAEGTTVAFYNGIRVGPNQEPPFRSRDYEIYVDWNVEKPACSEPTAACETTMVITSEYMDLPAEYIPSENYSASRGHKINHSFNPNCKWDTVEHPVFGRIPRVITLKKVEVGEELTCHYMIDMDEAGKCDNLSWYMEQWDIASQLENAKISEE